jgi:hypothetical protein
MAKRKTRGPLGQLQTRRFPAIRPEARPRPLQCGETQRDPLARQPGLVRLSSALREFGSQFPFLGDILLGLSQPIRQSHQGPERRYQIEFLSRRRCEYRWLRSCTARRKAGFA